MRTRHISCFPFHAIAIMLLFVFCARAKEATFKSSLPKQPINVVLPVGETLQVTLPRGFLDADLPDGEYDVEDVMEEYEWEVPGTPPGDMKEQRPWSAH